MTLLESLRHLTSYGSGISCCLLAGGLVKVALSSAVPMVGDIQSPSREQATTKSLTNNITSLYEIAIRHKNYITNGNQFPMSGSEVTKINPEYQLEFNMFIIVLIASITGIFAMRKIWPDVLKIYLLWVLLCNDISLLIFTPWMAFG